jgi:hypothetical protein
MGGSYIEKFDFQNFSLMISFDFLTLQNNNNIIYILKKDY